MTLAQRDNLLRRAMTIRDEQMEKANTASRVGSLLYDMVNELDGASSEEFLELTERVSEVEGTLEDANFGGGVVYAEKYSDDFETALNAAIAASIAEGRAFTTIDCTYFTGTWTFLQTVVIAYPVTLKLGNCHIVSKGENVFDVRSNNVKIEGVNRSTDRTATSVANMTVVELDQSELNVAVWNDSQKGYHIYSHGQKNCQYRNMFLLGRRTTLAVSVATAAIRLTAGVACTLSQRFPARPSAGTR